jgi:glyoxylase-like metal-dependent hydrolase (beta-lactamase superfamily II)
MGTCDSFLNEAKSTVLMTHQIDLVFQNIRNAIASFIVETSEGLVLVESGPHSTLPRIVAWLEERGWAMGDIRHVLLSHIHFDHAGAAWAFAEAGAMIHVHPTGLPHLAAPEKLYNSARQIYGEQMDSLWGAMQPINELRLSAPEHGEMLRIGAHRFTAWYTPGHAVHHIAWEMDGPAENAIFCGDVAGVKVMDGPVMPPCPPPDINVEDWLASIELLRACASKTLWLTHYGKVEDKKAHLDELAARLIASANWMRPYFEQQVPAKEIVPLFEAYMRKELTDMGLDSDSIKRYDAANPAFMSVNGLLRYWKKKVLP